MEREYISIEDIITSAQGSINDFFIKGRFLIISVREKIARNGTPYYSLSLEYKTGKLNANRFTSGELEFGSLNAIYLVGNIIEIEGIYQNEWNSMKIFTEKLIESIIEELPNENQDINEENFHKKNLTLLENQIDKFDELIKLTKLGTTIRIKSYINDLVKSVFDNASYRKIRKFKKSIEQHIEVWPEDKRDEFWNECSRTIRRYEALQAPKWKKWGSHLIKLISVLR